MFGMRRSGRGQKERTESQHDEGILVTYEDHKRIIPFTKDDQVATLRHQFLGVFSDVLEDQVAPAQVRFQRYNGGFQDYVDVSEDTKLERGDKLKAIVKHCGGKDKKSCETWWPSSRWWPRWAPAFVCPKHTCFIEGSPDKPYPIANDTQYRLWSPSSRAGGALLVRDPSTDIVSCNGVFDNPREVINTVVKTSEVLRRREAPLYGLIFEDSAQKRYATQANGTGANITAVEIDANGDLSNKQLFEVDYYWGYTMFKSFEYNTLYLGCDASGQATLLTIGSPFHPNPQTLFILNEFKGDTSPEEA